MVVPLTFRTQLKHHILWKILSGPQRHGERLFFCQRYELVAPISSLVFYSTLHISVIQYFSNCIVIVTFFSTVISAPIPNTHITHLLRTLCVRKYILCHI